VALGEAAPLAPPEQATLRTDQPDGWLPGFTDALEWRWLNGWLDEPGSGAVWVRRGVGPAAGTTG
jgi:hypothetical protein